MCVFKCLKQPSVLVMLQLQGCLSNSRCQTVDLYISDGGLDALASSFDIAYKRNKLDISIF